MRAILLADNGSRRPESALNLRRLAEALSARTGERIHPASLLHSDRIPAERLGGRAAETLARALRRLVTEGYRELVLLPLFFGPSRALTQFVPDTAAAIAEETEHFSLSIAPELCPLPTGEPRLASILLDNLTQTCTAAATDPRRVVLVDHGSPLPAVTAVRRWLGEVLAERLGPGIQLEQAVMERRADAEYDFNGLLLEELLDRLAREDPTGPIALSMLFLSAGRHAGPGGDIAEICERITARHPGLRIHTSPLVGDHPALIDILASRLADPDRWHRLSRADA